jgi:predicted RNA-binding protein (virulence factor B family)
VLEIGKYNILEVIKEVDFGIYLASDKGEILMPQKYVSQGTIPGDKLEVFIYKDSEDRLIATSLRPAAIVGEFAVLKAKQVNQTGAFMEWGLEKDLLVPHAEQHKPIREGEKYVVRICLDPKTERLLGVTRLSAFLSKNPDDLQPGDQVNLLIYEETDLGYMALINKKYRGILYKNEVFKSLAIGDEETGYIKRIREDLKIDLTLKKFGYNEVYDAKETVLKKLQQSGGMMAFSDESTPEDIKKNFNMSKKVFKKSIGALYKEGKIELLPQSILLKKM